MQRRWKINLSRFLGAEKPGQIYLEKPGLKTGTDLFKKNRDKKNRDKKPGQIYLNLWMKWKRFLDDALNISRPDGWLDGRALENKSVPVSLSDNFVGRTVAAAVVGGTTSVIGGGKFENGAKTAGFLRLFGEAASYYEKRVGWRVDATPGNELPKDSQGNCCRYIPKEGRTPGPDFIIVGLNEPLTGDWYEIQNFFKQGGMLRRALNAVPLINGIGHLHDVWWNTWPGQGVPFNGLTNYGTMLPAAGISVGAVVGSYTRGFETDPLILNMVSKR